MIKIVLEDAVKQHKKNGFNCFELTTEKTNLKYAIKELCIALKNYGYEELYNCFQQNSKELINEFIKTDSTNDPNMFKNGYWVNYCKKLPEGGYFLFHSEPVYDIIESTSCIASKTDYGNLRHEIYYFGEKPKIPKTLKDYLQCRAESPLL